MAKRSKAKKRRRVEHTIQLIRRHETEEEKVIRALGETNTPRDQLAQRTRKDWAPSWLTDAVFFDPSWPTWPTSSFITLDELQQSREDQGAFKRAYLNKSEWRDD